MASLTVAEIARFCQTDFEGDGQLEISGANSLDEAGPHDLSFVANAKAQASAATSRAGCLVVQSDFSNVSGANLIRVSDPRSTFARVLTQLYPSSSRQPAIHPTAIIDRSATVAKDAHIGPYVTIGRNVSIASGCSIGSHCIIEDSVTIGPDTILHPRVTVYHGAEISARCVLHSGCVLGADGFGFARTAEGYQKFPQVGIVVIEDDVEIGANTCIDRAALGRTVIGKGTKLDNLVQVAHNVRLGRDVVVAAQTGFSGGVTVGDGVVIGGQVGIADGARIDSKAVLGAQSGIVTKQHIRAGEPVWGTPARPLRQHLKGLAHVARLGEYRQVLKRLEGRLEKLEEKEREGTNS